MKKHFSLLMIAVCGIVITHAQKQVSLFNGKDLGGWTINGTEKWYVENGELVCESGTR